MLSLKRLSLCFVTALFLSACTTETLTPPEPPPISDEPRYDWNTDPAEPIVIWSRDHELDRVYMKRAFARYKDLTGNDIELIFLPQTEFEDKVQRAFAGDGEKPDILLSYGGTNLSTFNPDENLYDFSDAVWVNDLTINSINQTIYNYKVIGLPHWEASISGTLYNKSLFEEYNIAVPKTQEQFMSACQKLLDNGITPLYLPYETISLLLYQFPMDSIFEDSSVLSALNEGRLSYQDIPEMKQILEWYRTMSERGFLGTGYENNDWDGMDNALKSESYGMMLCWDTWLYTDFSGDPGEFGLMPAFMGVPTHGSFEGPNLGLLVVNKNSPRLTTVLNFITFLADPYNYNVAFDDIYTAPVFRNQYASISTPQYVESERNIERNFRDSVSWLRVKGFSQMDAICIQKYMTCQPGYTLDDCLRELDYLRCERGEILQAEGDQP